MAPFEGLVLSNLLRGVSGPKNRQILNRKSLDLADFLQNIALTLEPLRVNYS